MRRHRRSPIGAHRSVASRRRRGHRVRGFTLMEMMLSITIMLLVFGMAVPFFRSQLQAMNAHAGRFEAQQNARFGAATIDRELRIAGAGLPSQQPMIVQADPYAVTFNADLATSDSSSMGTFGAVYYDPDLNAAATLSLTTTTQITLPLSTTLYPGANYYNQAGPQSFAETISFWVARDTSAGAAGRYALYRRVNAMPATIVARGLVMRAGDPPPFTYVKLDTLGQPQNIPTSALPLFHVPAHGSPTDTGKSALTDSIRSVRIHLVGTYYGPRGDSAYRPIDVGIRLMNSGLLKLATCGDPPIFGQSIAATYVVGSSPQRVTVTFNRASDESGGEKDVERYAVYRRLSAATAFGEAIGSIPAGQSTYVFTDQTVQSGTSYVYGVAAQDCGGQFSAVSTSTVVAVP